MAEIGSTLREARMRARIDITEVEARTKIRAKYLRALENEEWDLLPGPVYVKSFVKTYGDFLGLDSRLLVDEFRRRYERPADHDGRTLAATTARERERRRQRQPSRVSSWLFSPRSVIGVALVVIVVALYLIGSHSGSNKNTGGGNTITPATTRTGGGHHPRGSTTTGASTGTTGTSTTPPPSASATLTLVPTGTIWVCVENQAGKPLVRGVTYNAGETIPTTRAAALLVTLGNTHVNMTVDGRPYTPTGSSAISLKITPRGVAPLATTPTCAQ